MISIPGEWTLITGATSGIGYEMARILAKKGQDMILVSRSEERLCEVARELSEESDIIIMPYDLSTPGSGLAIFNECERLGLNVTGLINNAGFGKFGESWDIPHEDIEDMLTLNIIALTSLCNLFAGKMKTMGKGNILNVASTAAYLPIPYFSAYSASKTYVKNFSKALREELKPHGVKVTCLLPGATKTKFAEVAFSKSNMEFFNMQRPMKADEVAMTGIRAMWKGQKVAIPGPVNKLVSFSANLVPLAALGKMIKRISMVTIG